MRTYTVTSIRGAQKRYRTVEASNAAEAIEVWCRHHEDNHAGSIVTLRLTGYREPDTGFEYVYGGREDRADG